MLQTKYTLILTLGLFLQNIAQGQSQAEPSSATPAGVDAATEKSGKFQEEAKTDEPGQAQADEDENEQKIRLGLSYRKALGLSLTWQWYEDDETSLLARVAYSSAPDRKDFDRYTSSSLSLLTRLNLETAYFLEAGLEYASIASRINNRIIDTISADGSYAFEASARQLYLTLSLGSEWQQDRWIYGSTGLTWRCPLPALACRVRAVAR